MKFNQRNEAAKVLFFCSNNTIIWMNWVINTNDILHLEWTAAAQLLSAGWTFTGGCTSPAENSNFYFITIKCKESIRRIIHFFHVHQSIKNHATSTCLTNSILSLVLFIVTIYQVFVVPILRWDAHWFIKHLQSKLI